MSFATSQTLAFVRKWLTQPSRVLEIGCGEGELAAALQSVIAIDSDPLAIGKAKARGVDARVATWPEFHDAPFDAVLFTRSLHHIEQLDRAVTRARELLKPGGHLIIEDFAPAEMSPRFLAWLRGELRRIGEEWEQEPVHPIADIRRAVASHFDIVFEGDTPYCHRYFPEAEAEKMFDAELALG